MTAVVPGRSARSLPFLVQVDEVRARRSPGPGSMHGTGVRTDLRAGTDPPGSGAGLASRSRPVRHPAERVRQPAHQRRYFPALGPGLPGSGHRGPPVHRRAGHAEHRDRHQPGLPRPRDARGSRSRRSRRHRPAAALPAATGPRGHYPGCPRGQGQAWGVGPARHVSGGCSHRGSPGCGRASSRSCFSAPRLRATAALTFGTASGPSARSRTAVGSSSTSLVSRVPPATGSSR